MARTRSIKPEFWTDEKLAKVSRDARLVFIGMWTASDDYGVLKAHSSLLKSQILPYDDMTLETFEKLSRELESIKRIVPFEANGEHYYYIPNFLRHQRIDHPSKQRNPEPPDTILETFSKQSRNNRFESESESESESETETETESESETETLASALPKIPVGKFQDSEIAQLFQRVFSQQLKWKEFTELITGSGSNAPDFKGFQSDKKLKIAIEGLQHRYGSTTLKIKKPIGALIDLWREPGKYLNDQEIDIYNKAR